MTVTIDLPDSVIADAALRAWRAEFVPPSYSNQRGAAGYEVVREQVSAVLMTPEMVEVVREQVRTIAAQLMPAVVRDVVGEQLRAMARTVVKDERRHGTLFEKGKS